MGFDWMIVADWPIGDHLTSFSYLLSQKVEKWQHNFRLKSEKSKQINDGEVIEALNESLGFRADVIPMKRKKGAFFN